MASCVCRAFERLQYYVVPSRENNPIIAITQVAVSMLLALAIAITHKALFEHKPDVKKYMAILSFSCLIYSCIVLFRYVETGDTMTFNQEGTLISHTRRYLCCN